MSTQTNLTELYENKVYQNIGNTALLQLVPTEVERVLDIGCGAGDNARLLKERGIRVWGVTVSKAEAEIARQHMESVLVEDVESSNLEYPLNSFDLLLFSHVMEHMIKPASVLNRLAPFLKKGGLALIAVPNMASYRNRMRMLLGNWKREDYGPFDRTHYQFWSYKTIDDLFKGTPFQPIKKVPGDAAFPMWPARRLLPRRLLEPIDRLGGTLFPNLCAWQVLVLARYVD